MHRALAVTLLVLSACGEESAPAPASTGDAPVAASATPSADGLAADAPAAVARGELAAPKLAEQLLAGEPVGTALDDDATCTSVVTELLQRGVAGNAVATGRASAAIQALGARAVPGLVRGFANDDAKTRRLAATCTLQIAPSLAAAGASADLIAALTAAKNDADLSVRAAAEHALRLATGDTSALDEARRIHEAAERASRGN